MTPIISRRRLMAGGLAAGAVSFSWAAGDSLAADKLAEGEELLPFLDPQEINPEKPALAWEKLQDWVTPPGQFFDVSHYGRPTIDAAAWRLEFAGLVEKNCSFTLDELKARPKREFIATLECSGNGASAKFMGAIGNARWIGTPLGPLLKECGIKPGGREVVFWGADEGKEKIRDQEYSQNFARSLSLDNAMRDDVILAYAMNDEPLSTGHGFPLRLIVPGWYGIAWVKWLARVEVRDRRFMNRFMARDYVTIRGEEKNGKTVWRETSVGPMNVKSIVARVVRRKDGTLGVSGAAWSDGRVDTVELKIDDGPWTKVRLNRDKDKIAPHAWTFWSYDWKGATPGEHRLVCRATDAKGRVQPAKDDPQIALKKTYWEANEQVVRRVKV